MSTDKALTFLDSVRLADHSGASQCSRDRREVTYGLCASAASAPFQNPSSEHEAAQWSPVVTSSLYFASRSCTGALTSGTNNLIFCPAATSTGVPSALMDCRNFGSDHTEYPLGDIVKWKLKFSPATAR